jgi:hypothetical protein
MTVVFLSLLLPSAANAETCRFAAADKENPFKRWLSSAEVVCSDAPVPEGNWNVFARSATGISTDASLELRPAAAFSVKLREGQRAVAYAPKFAVAYPITSSRTLVPAATELWLFVIEKNAPVGVFVLPPTEAEREFDARIAPPSTVVGWIRVSDEDRAAIENARSLPNPAVSAGSRGASISPLSLLNGSFVLAREVPAGSAEMEITGRGWLPHRLRTKVENAFTAVETPLPAQPSAALVVNWSTNGDLAALNALIGTCGTDPSSAHLAILVQRCAARDSEQCDVIRQEDIASGPSFGSFATENLVPGTYRVEMRFGRLPPVSAMIEAPPARVVTLPISARYVEVYGSLTLGGKPLDDDATMKFPGGAGFAPRGADYHAVLIDRIPLLGLDSRLDVAACKGSPKTWVLTEATLFRPGRLNVDIPDSELTIDVEDTFTHERIAGATLSYDVMSKMVPKRPVIRAKVQTTADAPVRIEHLPERELRILVSAPGYEKNALPPFSMSAHEKRTIDVQLLPLRGTEAKLVSAQAFESATIMWLGPRGIEEVDVAPDGAFIDAGTHGGQVMVVVSANHPLWITRMPQRARREKLEIRFPDGATARTFDIAVSSGDVRITRPVGLMIGGVPVPAAALQLHQSLRNLGAAVRVREPLRIRDIAETSPIDVFIGTNADDAPKKRLEPGATRITFE